MPELPIGFPALLSVFGALDFPIVVAGHQYDFRGSPTGETGGDDGGGGIGMASIAAVLFLVLVTVALLAWLNRREEGTLDDSRVGILEKLKGIAPITLTAVLIATPLALWTVSSGGEDDEETLIVERAAGVTGSPELIVYLEDENLNTLRTTHGKKTVRVECLTRSGQVVLDAEQRWPFINNEPGFDAPHVHQEASREQVQEADRCRLRGTSLEADVEGILTG
jgi:hypothetical protein